MLDKLILNNFPSGFEPQFLSEQNPFLVKTCQRTLVVSFGEKPKLVSSHPKIETFTGEEAYYFLLQIICGLKSKLVGENEIVSQFKNAYQEYNSQDQRCTQLLSIIEKLFKDAKEIRSKYLLGLSQKTYSSIARKHIVGKHKAESVLILGSGQLAEDLINQFKKKIKVYISARNPEKASKLAEQHGVEIVEWKNFEAYNQFPFIVNSIGCKHIILDEEFFGPWASRFNDKLFVDLGSPSCIKTELNYEQGVMKLDDVFEEGAIHETHKLNQISTAKIAMEGIVERRHQLFMKKSNNRLNQKNGNSSNIIPHGGLESEKYANKFQ